MEGLGRSRPGGALLELASAEGIRNIAFPAISCGVYRYPVVASALAEVADCLARSVDPFRFTFYCFEDSAFRADREALATVAE